MYYEWYPVVNNANIGDPKTYVILILKTLYRTKIKVVILIKKKKTCNQAHIPGKTGNFCTNSVNNFFLQGFPSIILITHKLHLENHLCNMEQSFNYLWINKCRYTMQLRSWHMHIHNQASQGQTVTLPTKISVSNSVMHPSHAENYCCYFIIVLPQNTAWKQKCRWGEERKKGTEYYWFSHWGHALNWFRLLQKSPWNS